MTRAALFMLAVAAVCAVMPPAGAEAGREKPLAAKQGGAVDQDAANLEMKRRAQAGNKRSQEISRILAAYRTGELDSAAARKQLGPLLSAQAQEQLSTADQQIAQLRQQIAAVETLKRNSKQWVQMRMDQLMGGGPPPTPKDGK